MLKISTCAVVAALSICFLAAPPLSAATIFNFSGTVDRIDGSSAEALYTIGDLVTGSVVMDATAEPISSYVSRSLYGADAYLSASLFLNGAPAFSSVAYNSFIWVERSETHGDDVLFDVIQNQAISKPITEYLAIPGISIGYFAMRLAGPPGTLPDFTLNANWNLSDFTEGFWEVAYGDGLRPDTAYVGGKLNAFAPLATVPLDSPLLYLSSALVIMGFLKQLFRPARVNYDAS